MIKYNRYKQDKRQLIIINEWVYINSPGGYTTYYHLALVEKKKVVPLG